MQAVQAQPENPVVLQVRNVKKRIGAKEIIKGISFEVREGEVFGFLGPNGAGKTTTIRMLVNLIRPTEGSVLLCGKDVHREHEEALRNVGCIVENPELYPYLSGWDNLDHFAGMLSGVDDRRIEEVVAIVGLGNRIHDKVKTYSLGMRQRLGIAQALLGRPRLLILDEPTNGLDPQGIKEMREFIRSLADNGMSIFVSSHLLSEIQQMCDRVAIMSQGRVLAVGGVDELLNKPKERVVWTLEPLEEGLRVLDRLKAGTVVKDTDGRTVQVRMEPERIAAWNAALVKAGVNVLGIETKQPSLEELFLELTEGERIE